MKTYNQTFTYQLSVAQVANTLLDKLIGNSGIGGDITESQVQYFDRVVEAIIDPLVGQPQALGNLFNALNGWVQLEVPTVKKEIPRHMVATVYTDTNEMWAALCDTKYIGMTCQGQNVVGIVNYIDNGINISFKLKNVVRGIEVRKLYDEKIHLSDINQAEDVVAYVADSYDYEEYLRQIEQWVQVN